MTREKIRLSEAGFTIMEVMIAGTIALMVIFALFGAIRNANEQTHFVDKKKDELNLLADIRYMLSDPVLCKDRLKLTYIYPGVSVDFELRSGLVLKKGALLPPYMLRVKDFLIADGELVTELRTHLQKDGKTIVERLETQSHVMVRTYPNQEPPGEVIKTVKTYYVDLELTTTTLGKKFFNFAPARVARVRAERLWIKGMKHEEFTCLADKDSFIPPIDYQRRMGSLIGANVKSPSEQVAEMIKSNHGLGITPGSSWNTISSLTYEISGADKAALLQGAEGGSGQNAIGSPAAMVPTMNPWESPYKAWSSPWDDSGGGGQSAPAQQAEEQRNTASVAPGAATNNASVPSAANTSSSSAASSASAAASKPSDGSCAVNISLERAKSFGFPVTKHGQYLSMPLPDCMEKKFLCWEGTLRDANLPATKRQRCDTVVELTPEEMATQLITVGPKPEPKLDCAVNATLEKAKAMHWPTYKTGERTMMASGECEEKSYVCWDGRFMDEGLPAKPVKNCKPAATNVAGVN
ncbi:MAG TPA: hypothetical protein VIH99_02605 [Bdellovibrionota bacterium]|jgi:hypothetical protein